MKPSLLALFAATLLSACAPGTQVPLHASGGMRSADPTATRVDLADAMLETDRPDAALKIIRKARDEGHDSPDLTVVQARALIAQGLDGEAEALLDSVVVRTPRHAGALAALGILYLEQRRTDDAIGAFAKALKMTPTDPDLRNNLGFALLAGGHFAEAEAELREAVRLDPGHSRARNNLGFALAALGRIDEAREAFRAVAGSEAAEHNLRLAARLYPSPTPSEAP
jgi:Flp pilus assembly protein TadD